MGVFGAQSNWSGEMERLRELITSHIGNAYCLDDLFRKTRDNYWPFSGFCQCPETSGTGKLALDGSTMRSFVASVFTWGHCVISTDDFMSTKPFYFF